MYSKTMESKLIRTTHKITFDIGHSVASFKEELARVPDHLRLTDIEEDETGNTVLCFLHEQVSS